MVYTLSSSEIVQAQDWQVEYGSFTSTGWQGRDAKVKERKWLTDQLKKPGSEAWQILGTFQLVPYLDLPDK